MSKQKIIKIVNCSNCGKEVERSLGKFNEAIKLKRGFSCSLECQIIVANSKSVASRKMTKEKVLSYINKEPGQGPNGDCWEWKGYVNPKNKYGYISWKERSKDGKGSPVRAHRIVYELLVGEIPKELVLMHSCDNPPCVNPAHLSPGTNQENDNDRVKKNRQAKGTRLSHFPHLTDELVREIKIEFRNGAMPAPIAKKYKISKATAKSIKYENAWKHITI